MKGGGRYVTRRTAPGRGTPPRHAAPRSPSPGSPVGQTPSTEGSTPVRAASPYHRALDFGVRASVA